MYIKYLSYVIRHKWYVFVECCKVGEVWRGITHDLSKLLPSEFIPYARYFYGAWTKEEDWRGDIRNHIPWELTEMGASEAFDKAWLLHQKRNPHHWQWWLLPEDNGGIKYIPMTDKYRKEMLADWKGAGKAINGYDDTINWYRNNKNNMRLHPETRTQVEEGLVG